MTDKVVTGDATLYLGDCAEILPTLGRFDAIVTDPPYGIGADNMAHKNSGTLYGVAIAPKRTYAKTNWDCPASPEFIQYLLDCSDWQIIFGGNFYAMPPTSCYLVWDKLNGINDFADCELAWTNLNKSVRKIEWLWNGFSRKGQEERFNHPTQKPVGVMRWCISHLPADVETICDPFMGSGTTGVAAIQAGKKFVGIEREPSYFEIAVKRIKEASDQGRLFDEPKRKAPPHPAIEFETL